MAITNIPIYDIVQDPVSGNITETNPAYQVITSYQVKMETNPAYQEMPSDKIRKGPHIKKYQLTLEELMLVNQLEL